MHSQTNDWTAPDPRPAERRSVAKAAGAVRRAEATAARRTLAAGLGFALWGLIATACGE